MTVREPQLRRRLYALGFVDEFGPIYALYTVFFLDNGITTSQISTIFVLWAAIELAFEVPSGALADRVDRRKLLAVAFVLRAVGISIWLIEPTFDGVVVGATLWALHASLASGAWEALIHDELAANGEAGAYAPVMGRISQFSSVGVALGTVVASVFVGLGGTILALGWITVAIHAVSIVLVLTLPDVRWLADEERMSADPTRHVVEVRPRWDIRAGMSAWTRTLRDGVTHAWSSRTIVRLLGLGSVVMGLYVVDEYVPILADLRDTPDDLIPLFVLAVFVGVIAGGEFVARRPDVAPIRLGLGLVATGALVGVALLTEPAWTLLLIGVGYAAYEAVWIVQDARLQEHVPVSVRATVTSLRSLGGNLVGVAAFAVVGLLSDDDDPTAGLLVVAGVLVVTGLVAMRWIPPATPADDAPSPLVSDTGGDGADQS